MSPSIRPHTYFNLVASLAFKSMPTSRRISDSSIRPYVASSSVRRHHHRPELQQDQHVHHPQHQHPPRPTSASSTDQPFLRLARIILPQQSTLSTVGLLLHVLDIFRYACRYTERWAVTVSPHQAAALPHMIINKPPKIS